MLLALAGVLVVLGVLYGLFNVRLRPLVTRMAVSRVSNIAMHAMNDAINNEISNGNIDYDRLIQLEKDGTGRVTALKTNMVEVNRLKSEITNKVLDQIEVYTTSDINIPLGSVISDNLFSGRGPKIPIRIISVSSAGASMENVFMSAGINQTRHQIVLKLTISIGILLPGYSTTTGVETAMSVAETIIIGEVPENYTFFDNVSDAEEAAEHYFNFT